MTTTYDPYAVTQAFSTNAATPSVQRKSVPLKLTAAVSVVSFGAAAAAALFFGLSHSTPDKPTHGTSVPRPAAAVPRPAGATAPATPVAPPAVDSSRVFSAPSAEAPLQSVGSGPAQVISPPVDSPPVGSPPVVVVVEPADPGQPTDPGGTGPVEPPRPFDDPGHKNPAGGGGGPIIDPPHGSIVNPPTDTPDITVGPKPQTPPKPQPPVGDPSGGGRPPRL